MDTQPFTDWYAARRARTSGKPPARNTVRTKAQRLRTCAEVMGATSCENLATLIQSRQGVDALLDRLHARMSPGSARVAVDMLSDFARYCDAMGWPVPPLTAADRPGANPPKPIVVYTEEELHTLLLHARVAHDQRWWLFLETLVGTGRRVGEVLGLQYAWLNTSAEPPHFHLPTTKNGRQAYVPLNAHLLELWTPERIKSLKHDHRSQFGRDPEMYPFPWTYTCAHRMFVRYCARVGVESRGFHCFRHTRATTMLAKGVPLQAVSALLGHANVATTDRVYNHTNALTYAEYA
ncbi:MAG: tyrosine-type recombinase/integrase [Mycobacteriaceae bacterium]